MLDNRPKYYCIGLLLTIILFIYGIYWTNTYKVESFLSLSYKTQNLFSLTSRNYQFKSLEDIHNKIWYEIQSLQEYGNCEEKKILHCENIGSIAGFGSMLQRYTACYQIAYALGRIVFIHQPEYEHFNGLSKWLKVGSKKCGYLKSKYGNYSSVCNLDDSKCYLSNGYDVNNTYKVLAYNSNLRWPAPRTTPGTLPKQIQYALRDFNIKTPWLWFTSQFLGYILLHSNRYFQDLYKNFSTQINYTEPIVAMHIRHGDKINKEASYINETHYYRLADQYFYKKFPQISPRKIFIASDDPDISTVMRQYLRPNDTILRLPEDYRKRSITGWPQWPIKPETIESMLLELYFMAHADYTICTYSSNVGRTLYSMKLSIYPFTDENRIASLPGAQATLGYFWWFPFKFPSKYVVTIRRNSFNIPFFDGNQLIRYEPGILFEVRGGPYVIKQNLKVHDVYLLSSKYRKGNVLKGYVYVKDVILWPGSPSYHFYPEDGD